MRRRAEEVGLSGTFSSVDPLDPFDLTPQTPTPSPTPAPKRNYVGWVLALGIAGLIIVTQLITYLQKDSDENSKVAGMETTLRLVVMQRNMMEALTKMSGQPISAANKAQMDKPLEDLAAMAAPFRFKDVRAARLYAVIRTEQGQPVQASDLKALASAKKPADRAFASIYSEPNLTPDRAGQLVDKLPDEPFVYQMAAMHAKEKAGDKKVRTELFPPGRAMVTMLAIFGILLLGFAGFGLWVVYAVARSRGKLKPVGSPMRFVDAALSDHLALRAGLCFLAFLLVDALAYVLLPKIDGIGWTSVVHSGVLTIAIVVVAMMTLQGRKLGLRAIGVNRDHVGKNIGWGIMGAVANIPILVFMILLGQMLFPNLPTPEHPITKELMQGQAWATLAIVMLLAAVFAPIAEEIWFRGLFLPPLARAMGGPAGGIFAVSLLFAMVHPTGVPAWPALAAVGAMAAVLTYQTGSLVPAIVMHGVHNGATLLLALAIT